MKKVSVQFNLVVQDDVTHQNIKDWLETGDWLYDYYEITSIQINNTEKRGKR